MKDGEENQQDGETDAPPPSENTSENGEEEMAENNEGYEAEEPGMWEETFKSHHDSKPYG